MKGNALLFILIVTIVAIGYLVYNKLETKEDSLQPNQTTEVSSSEELPKSKAEEEREFIKETVNSGLEKAGEFIEKKNRKDSITFANRKKFFVYQIGMPKRSPEEHWSTYEKLRDLGNICLFKVSRNTYYLIKQGGYTEESLLNSKEEEESYLKSKGINDPLEVLEISSFCNENKEAKIGRSEKVNKEKITCYVCQ